MINLSKFSKLKPRNKSNISRTNKKVLFVNFESGIISQDIIFSTAVSPNGKYVVSGSDDKVLNLYNIESQTQIHQFLDAHEGLFSKI